MALIGKRSKAPSKATAQADAKKTERKTKRVAPKAKRSTSAKNNGVGAYKLFGKPLVGDLVAIDLQDDFIRLAVAKLKKNNVVIKEIYEKRIDSGLIVDGDLIEEEAVYQLMRAWFNEERIEAKNAFFSIERSDIIRREMAVSTSVDEKDIEGYVSYELAQYLDIDISSYIVQYQEIGIEEDDLGEASMKLMVHAMPRAIAEKRFNLAKNLKLTPYAFDIRSNTLQKWVNDVVTINEEPTSLRSSNVGLIYMDDNELSIGLYSNGKFSTGQAIREGYKQLDEKIAIANRISTDQAATIRREYYGEQDRNMYGIGVDESLHTVVNQWIEKVIGKVRDTEDFFRRTDSGAVDSYYIYGVQGEVEKAVQFIEGRLKKPVIILRSFDSTTLQWEVDGKLTIPGALLNTLAMFYRLG